MKIDLQLRYSEAQYLKIKCEIPKYFFLPSDLVYQVNSPSFMFAKAIWRFRVYPNHLTAMVVELVRLHSLVLEHEIATKFVVQVDKEDVAPKLTYDYKKLYYTLNPADSYHMDDLCKTSPIMIHDKESVPDSSLVFECDLISEVSTKTDKLVQECYINLSQRHNLYEDHENNSRIIPLKSSKGLSLEIVLSLTISKYSSLPSASEFWLSTQSFAFSSATWFLKLYPNITTANSGIKVVLVRLCSSVSRHKIVTRFGLRLSNGIWLYDQKNVLDEFYFKDNNECEFRNSLDGFPERSALIKKYKYDGGMTFCCQLFCEEDDQANVQNFARKFSHTGGIYHDMKNLLRSGRGHDLTLKVNDREFPVHQVILEARSQAFASMLTSHMTAENRRIVELPDCDPEIIQQLLLYLYCGKVDSLNETINMLGLYYAADKYNLMPLKKECRDFIRNSLTCLNVCEVMDIAKKVFDKDLLEFSKTFFANNVK